MSTSAVTVPEPAAQSEAAAEETPVASRPPLVELLPSGAWRPFVAVAMAVAVAASFADFGLHGRALVGAVFCPALILLAAIDAKHRLLPNTIIFPATVAIAMLVAASTPGDFPSHLAAGAALGGFFLVFGTFFAGSIGFGDAKLGFLIGLALGSKTLGAMLVASAGVLVAALYVLATRGLSARKDAIPFGPYLALGGIVAYFLS
jgi:leader peptidase (prepilin peptidase) / N-methyltransferase